MDSSRIGTCLKKLQTPFISVLCTGMSMMAAIFSYRMFWKTNEFEDNKEKNLSSIFDLEEIIEKRGWAMFKMDQESTRCFPGTQTEAELKLNWDGVTEYPGNIEFTKINNVSKNKDQTHVIFQTVFQNTGYTDQHHKLRAKGDTSMVCYSYLTKGYTKGSELGLSFPTPVQDIRSTFKFSREFSMKYAKKNFEEAKTAWIIDDFICVPRQTKITVSKSVKERKQEFSFKAKVGFKGSVIVMFKDKKNKSTIVSYPIPIKTIICEELPKYLQENTKKNKKKNNGKGPKDIKDGEKNMKNGNGNLKKEEIGSKKGEKYLKNAKENMEKREENIKDEALDLKNGKEYIEKRKIGIPNWENATDNNTKGEEDITDLKNSKENIGNGEKEINDWEKDLKIATENIGKVQENITDEQKYLRNTNSNIKKEGEDIKDEQKDLRNVNLNIKKEGEDIKDEQQDLRNANSNIKKEGEDITDEQKDLRKANSNIKKEGEDIKDEQKDISFIIIEGRCHFKYEIEQDIDIDEHMICPCVSKQCTKPK